MPFTDEEKQRIREKFQDVNEVRQRALEADEGTRIGITYPECVKELEVKLDEMYRRDTAHQQRINDLKTTLLSIIDLTRYGTNDTRKTVIKSLVAIFKLAVIALREEKKE